MKNLARDYSRVLIIAIVVVSITLSDPKNSYAQATNNHDSEDKGLFSFFKNIFRFGSKSKTDQELAQGLDPELSDPDPVVLNEVKLPPLVGQANAQVIEEVDEDIINPVVIEPVLTPPSTTTYNPNYISGNLSVTGDVLMQPGREVDGVNISKLDEIVVDSLQDIKDHDGDFDDVEDDIDSIWDTLNKKFDKNGGTLSGSLTATSFSLPTGATNGYVLTSDASGNATWQAAGVGGDSDWTVNGNNQYSAVSGNVGIGTTSPEFKLSLADDGAIIATGTFSSGDTLSTAGAGTRMIWYPRKAAFRAGSVDGTQWNDASVGIYSTAFGRNNTASGDYSSVAAGYNNTASAYTATVAGGYYNRSQESYAAIGGGGGNTASGNGSVIAGGYGNTNSGYRAAIIGGSFNTVSDDYAVVGGGYMNNASNNNAMIFGGESNAASGRNSSIMGGRNNTASNYYSTVLGGYRAAASKYGQVAFASGRFAATGDAQTSFYTLRRSTTNDTQTNLGLDGSTGANGTLDIAANTTYTFDATITGRSDAGASAGYHILGVIERDGSNNTALVGSITKTVLGEDTVGWDATIEADDTNEALSIRVTGAAATNIRWVATVKTTEVIY